MARARTLIALLGATFLAACGSDRTTTGSADGDRLHSKGNTHGKAHWGYEDDNGPASWASMQADWQLCGEGRRQSPVDLTAPTERALPPIAVHALGGHAVEVLKQFHVLEELDNGHTVQVNAPLPDALQIDDKAYSLRQFHFHSPSEHTVDGEHLPMEIHFVNEAADGSLAVLGVLVSAGNENSAIESLWKSLPEGEGDSSRTQLPESFLGSLMTDAGNGFYHYSGSLTTPPCTEGVQWTIKKSPTELSEAQIGQFRTLYDHNNRPLNPLNDRHLYFDSSPSVELFDGTPQPGESR